MMNRVWKRRASSEGGFTLVELLVVIAIIGILAAVAVFAISGTTTDSKRAACKSDVATVQTASDAFYAKTGAYAKDIAALVSAKYLRSAPPTTNGYTIAYTVADGGVSAKPLCTAVP